MEAFDKNVDKRKITELPWSVYILYSKKFDRKYVGMSASVSARFNEHNSGKVKSTKAFRPWILIYSEPFLNRVIARKKEKFWKSGDGRERIKEMAKKHI